MGAWLLAVRSRSCTDRKDLCPSQKKTQNSLLKMMRKILHLREENAIGASMVDQYMADIQQLMDCQQYYMGTLPRYVAAASDSGNPSASKADSLWCLLISSLFSLIILMYMVWNLLFWGLNRPKEGLFQSKQGSFWVLGAMYMSHLNHVYLPMASNRQISSHANSPFATARSVGSSIYVSSTPTRRRTSGAAVQHRAPMPRGQRRASVSKVKRDPWLFRVCKGWNPTQLYR